MIRNGEDGIKESKLKKRGEGRIGESKNNQKVEKAGRDKRTGLEEKGNRVE